MKHLLLFGVGAICCFTGTIDTHGQDWDTDYYAKGRKYYFEDKNDSALVWLDKAVAYPVDTTNHSRIMETLLLRSRVLGSLTFFERAMDDAIRSFDISKKQGIDNFTALSLLAIGKVHYLMYNDSVAEDYMTQARRIAEEHHFQNELMQVKNALAQLYSVLERNEECLSLAEESLEMAKQQRDTVHIIQNLSLFASYYINLNRWTNPIIADYQHEAKRYIDEALQLASLQNIPMLINTIYLHLIRYWRVEKDYQKALEAARRVIEMCEPTHYTVLIQVYDHLVGIYAHLGDKEKVIHSHQQFHVLMRRQSDYNLHQSLQDTKVRYETAEKEAEISRQALIIARQKTQHLILFLILGLSTVILLLLWYFLRMRSRRTKELAEMNATKDKFFSIISHDLKNPVLSQRDALQLLADNGDKWNIDRQKVFYGEILKSADGQVELLYDLLNWAQAQTGRMPFIPSQFDLVAELRSLLEMAGNMARRKEIIFDVCQPASALVMGDAHMLATVVRNLLANAVKFTTKGGTVTFEIKPGEKGTWIVSVSDTGIGMSEGQVEDLFRIDRYHSQTGTAGEQGTGLGLIVCKELLEKHGAGLHVESEKDRGSRFWFELHKTPH